MSSITGTCSQSESQLLFEKGLQETQNQRIQEQNAVAQNNLQTAASVRNQTTEPNTISRSERIVEAHKGLNVDVYA